MHSGNIMDGIGSWHIANKAIFSLNLIVIICLMHESLGSNHNGRIKKSAKVDWNTIMDFKSVAEPHCHIEARAHLFRGAKVGAYAFVAKNVLLFEFSIIQSHVNVGYGAKIGSRTICETYSEIGPEVVLFESVIIKSHVKVLAGAVVGRYSMVEHYAIIGRRAQLHTHVCVAANAVIGPNAIVQHNAIVENFAVVWPGMNIDAYTVVISAPETSSLLRILSGVSYSNRFHHLAYAMAQQSNTVFAEQFFKEFTFILSDLGQQCKRNDKFAPQIVFLVYSYLLHMHGKNKLQKLLWQKVPRGHRTGPQTRELNDCRNRKRFSAIFNSRTTEKFVLVLALYYDFYRRNRMDNDGTLDDFCAIVRDIMANKRNVVAINETCGGHLKAHCKGCKHGHRASQPPSIDRNDMNFAHNQFFDRDQDYKKRDSTKKVNNTQQQQNSRRQGRNDQRRQNNFAQDNRQKWPNKQQGHHVQLPNHAQRGHN